MVRRPWGHVLSVRRTAEDSAAPRRWSVGTTVGYRGDDPHPQASQVTPRPPGYEEYPHQRASLPGGGRAAAGIRAARTWLESFEGHETLVVERFDRLGTYRIHTEDLCQALGVRPRHKYQYDGGPGPAEIARLLRDAAQPGDDLRFFDALAYNWLVGATDAHAKNFSLVPAGTEVTLAPVYDTASWIPYAISPERYRFAMKLGGDYRLAKSNPGRDWADTARSMGLDRVADLATRLPEAFTTAVAGIGNGACKDIASDLAESIVGHVQHNRRALDHGFG